MNHDSLKRYALFLARDYRKDIKDGKNPSIMGAIKTLWRSGPDSFRMHEAAGMFGVALKETVGKCYFLRLGKSPNLHRSRESVDRLFKQAFLSGKGVSLTCTLHPRWYSGDYDNQDAWKFDAWLSSQSLGVTS